MNDDRRSILEMLATGRITADEADRLLAALEKGPGAGGGANAGAGYISNRVLAKYLRIQVDTHEDDDEGPTKVNIRVPMQLLTHAQHPVVVTRA